MRIYTMLTGLMETNCYLVVTKERHIAVIDPGADPETIIAKLEDLGSEPSMILLTHAHYDHTGAVEALCKRYPDCPVMLGEKELPVYGDPNLSLAPMLGGPKEPQKLRYDRLLHEGDTIQLDELTFTVLETPGHTPGGVCYQVGDVIFSGDTLFQLSVGRTDFPGGEEIRAAPAGSARGVYHLSRTWLAHLSEPGTQQKPVYERITHHDDCIL